MVKAYSTPWQKTSQRSKSASARNLLQSTNRLAVAWIYPLNVRRSKAFFRLSVNEFQYIKAPSTLPAICRNVANLLNFETDVFDRRSSKSLFQGQVGFMISCSYTPDWELQLLERATTGGDAIIWESIDAHAHNRTKRFVERLASRRR